MPGRSRLRLGRWAAGVRRSGFFARARLLWRRLKARLGFWCGLTAATRTAVIVRIELRLVWLAWGIRRVLAGPVQGLIQRLGVQPGFVEGIAAFAVGKGQ